MAGLLRFSLLLIWACAVGFLVWRHVVWRDEVRAMSLALQADSLGSLLGGLGDGHPPLWYFLVRGAHVLIPRPESLQILATAIGVASMALFVFRSRFGLVVTALVLFSRFALYEYTVMARNYGISMLLLFMLAMLYKKWRDRGVVLGLLLVLLAACNLHSVLLAGAFLAFWLGDIFLDAQRDRRAALRVFAANAAIAALGIAYAVLTVHGTLNDAVPGWRPGGLNAARFLRAVFLPAQSFADLSGLTDFGELLGNVSLNSQPWTKVWTWAMSAVMFGSILGLARRPAAMAAAALALVALSLFFALIYPGSYRHEALWLVFLLCLYWATKEAEGASEVAAPMGGHRTFSDAVGQAGQAALIVLLLVQVEAGVRCVVEAASGRYESQIQELGALILREPKLRDAIVVADPDFLVEPLAYYAPNRTYLLREQRFSNVPWFTRRARLTLSLGEILQDAKTLHSASGKPVIILMKQRLDPSRPEAIVHEGYSWQLSTTPEQVRSFLASTRLVQPASSRIRENHDESYDVYVLDPS